MKFGELKLIELRKVMDFWLNPMIVGYKLHIR
jgi:hypothetical protein